MEPSPPPPSPQLLPLSQWHTRTDAFVNVFFVWSSHRDSWSAIQDRVVGSVVATIPGARVRIVSNTLPADHFAALSAEGFDVAVLPFDILSLLVGLPGRTWLADAQRTRSAHLGTHLSDLVRLLVLYKYGGLYLDTDAFWLRDVADLPPAFIGKIDFLPLGPSCDWCLDGRWYLANGVLSFPAEHPFLLALLLRIERTPYLGGTRTAIGPQFVTTAFLDVDAASRAGLVVLGEAELYPIPGPSIAQYFAPIPDAESAANSLIRGSHSVHLFAHTFGQRNVDASSVFGAILRANWPENRPGFCRCTISDSAPGLCVPPSAIIEYREPTDVWLWPSARLCIRPAAVFYSGVSTLLLTVTAKRGAVRTWSLPPSRSLQLTLKGPFFLSADLDSLEYRHVGEHCNDEVTVTLEPEFSFLLMWARRRMSSTVFVSAPCFGVEDVAARPPELRPVRPSDWAYLTAPPVPSITTADLDADPFLSRRFRGCLVDGSRERLGASDAEPLRVGILVSASGTYVSWLDGLITSAETHFFRGAPNTEVHYFVLSDVPELHVGPPARTHLILQPRLGWPFDSMFRHQLYLKHRAAFRGMDFLLVLDADLVFVNAVGSEILGRTLGVLQSFSFGKEGARLPFERYFLSSAFVSLAEGRCYFAGGVFGGTFEGLATLLRSTTWLMEWDLAVRGESAIFDDESYLNKVFTENPPSVSLGANYVFPEPPADRVWDLKGVAWTSAFPPRIYNLGARKALNNEVKVVRDYRTTASGAIDPIARLSRSSFKVGDALRKGQRAASLAIGVFASLSGTGRQRGLWLSSFVSSARKWAGAGQFTEVVVVDTAEDAGVESLGPLNGGAKGLMYLPLAGGSPTEALQLVLASVQKPSVLLLDAAYVLTWQAHVEFLLDALDADDGIVTACPRLDDLLSDPPQESCGFVFPTSGSPASAVAFPPHWCSPCSAAGATVQASLQREMLGETADYARDTELRRLTCWRSEGLHGHALVLLRTMEAVSLALALASSERGTFGPIPKSCGIGCMLDRALAVRSGPLPRVLSCLGELTPLLRVDVGDL
jgi:hypothetical protein